MISGGPQGVEVCPVYDIPLKTITKSSQEPNFDVFFTTCSVNSRSLQVGILQPLLGMQVTPWIWHHHL